VNHKNDDIKAAFGLSGVVSMLASIPFFVASGKNKKRAISVSGYLKMHKNPLLVKNDKNLYPAIPLKITF
jgi:energy-converting hydrogenase Eha subunit H